MMIIDFYKMHGFGNDFVIITEPLQLDKSQVQFICDRRFGVGCDQLLLVKYTNDTLTMLTYNSDGSPAGFCGNGARCLVKLGYLLNKFDANRSITIFNGEDSLEAIQNQNGMIEINLNSPKIFKQNCYDIEQFLNLDEIDLLNLISRKVSYVNVGNAHLIVFVKDLNFDLQDIGGKIQSLFPEGINVNFVQPLNEKTLKVRTVERGTGLTNACGSGASAAAFCAYKLEMVNENVVEIRFERPNDFLMIKINDLNEIIMIGDCDYVFDGKLKIENFLKKDFCEKNND